MEVDYKKNVMVINDMEVPLWWIENNWVVKYDHCMWDDYIKDPERIWADWLRDEVTHGGRSDP